MYGWRGKIGVVLPSNNTVMEPELYQLLPPGVSAHFTRILAVGTDADALLQMSSKAQRAIGELSAAGTDTFLYACLSTSLARGPDWDAQFMADTEARTGRTCLTAAAATVRAIHAVGATRIGLVSPYPDDIHDLLPGFLSHHGIAVSANVSLRISDIQEVCRRTPWEVYRTAKALQGTFEALVILATDLRTIDVIDPLERDLGVPVVTTNQALVWMALNALNIRESIAGFGSLFERPIGLAHGSGIPNARGVTA